MNNRRDKKNKKVRIKIRKFWNINSRTKVKENEKKYGRAKDKKKLKDLLKEFL